MLARVHPYDLDLARRADAAALAAMSRQLVEAGLRPAWDVTRITWHIRDSESVVLLARGVAGTAGFAIMRYADDSAHLNLLAVAPAHRRRGIGRRLVMWLEETALTAGTFTIGLELRAGNAAARAFYAALGYREVGSVVGYYQGRESAIRMERDVRERREATPSAAAPPGS
ncbi:MAG TPA: GNAT family N-acetyltransferase [Steroidobacteraceae bacterium]|nr:GNAT family N-acetyltransferase [Steroidobacteraceae bacterium]